MIEAEKSKRFNAIFYSYNKYYLLRRYLHEIMMHGHPDSIKENSPVVYIMNHCSWWDGMIVYHAWQTVSRGDHYIMMDERQMKSFRFFRKIGAFSIDKTKPREIVRSLDYSAKLLEEGKRVWMFPQGDFRHLEQRPLGFQSGIGRLLSTVPEAVVVPVTLYYTLTHQRPQASIWFGAAVEENWAKRERHETTALLEQVLTAQLDAHRAMVIAGTHMQMPASTYLLRAAKRTDETFASVRKKVMQWLR